MNLHTMMRDQIIQFGDLLTDSEYSIHQRKHNLDDDTPRKIK
jgi:hypothetical protein